MEIMWPTEALSFLGWLAVLSPQERFSPSRRFVAPVCGLSAGAAFEPPESGSAAENCVPLQRIESVVYHIWDHALLPFKHCLTRFETVRRLKTFWNNLTQTPPDHTDALLLFIFDTFASVSGLFAKAVALMLCKQRRFGKPSKRPNDLADFAV